MLIFIFVSKRTHPGAPGTEDTHAVLGWVARAFFKEWSQQVLFSRPLSISSVWSGATRVVTDGITPACLQPGELTASAERQGSPRLSWELASPP